MTALEAEAHASILHEDAGALRDNAAAEGLIDRVDETAGVSVAVDDRERDRIAMRRERALSRRRQMGKGALIIDELGERGEIIRRDEAADRRLAAQRVGEKGVSVPVGEPRGFDVPVKSRSAIRAFGCGTERFENAEDHEGDDAWSVGRALPDVEPLPARAERLDKFCGVASVGEILLGLQSAGRPQRRDHVGCDGPGVERVRPARGDCLKRASERRLDEQRAFLRRPAAGEEELVSRTAQLFLLPRPIPRHARMHRKSVLRIADGGRQQLVEALGSVRVQEQLPSRIARRGS